MSDSRGAVLLSPPFGQEAIRLHRFFRVLADRLSRTGCSTMRFDYFGTGDSDGDDAEGDFDGWCRDLQLVDGELRRRAGDVPVIWLGAGLGATLALSASQSAARRPLRLVLWEPVLQGHLYLEDLRVKHMKTLERSYERAGGSGEGAEAFLHEAIGFAIAPALREQISRLAPDTLGRHVVSAVDVAADPRNAVVKDWTLAVDRAGVKAVFHPLELEFDWATEELGGTALVPSLALKTMLSICAKQSHA